MTTPQGQDPMSSQVTNHGGVGGNGPTQQLPKQGQEQNPIEEWLYKLALEAQARSFTHSSGSLTRNKGRSRPRVVITNSHQRSLSPTTSSRRLQQGKGSGW